jgi:hypothetical protein
MTFRPPSREKVIGVGQPTLRAETVAHGRLGEQVLGSCRVVLELAPQLGHVLPDAGRVVDVERDGLPSNDEIALVVRRAGVTLGHFRLTAAARVARPSLEQRRVAIPFADQVVPVMADRQA